MILPVVALAFATPAVNATEEADIEEYIDKSLSRGPTSTTQTADRPEVLNYHIKTPRCNWSELSVANVLAKYRRNGWSVAPGHLTACLATLSISRPE